ncbi:MAG TPA: hypothetical protein VFT74_17135 [Isosphaeraceae bacterium]|nr:hypothetical protein [Isosphaeraceae bacterium]
MPNFAEQLEATVATLARPLRPEDGEPEASLANAEEHLGVRLPQVLRDYHLLSGRFDRFNRSHNRLLRPDEWFLDGGKLVFLEENQGVVYWGVDATLSPGEYSPVYQGPNIQGQPTEWYLEHENLSEFLLVHLHLQAVWGGYDFMGGAGISIPALEEFLVGWTFSGQVNELRAYDRKGGAACVLEEGGEESQLYFGGWTEQDFESIESDLRRVGVKIEHY